MFEKKPKYAVVDTETTGLHFMKCQMHGLGYMEEGDARAVYYRRDQIPERVRQIMADPTISKVGHNLHAFDAKFIRRAGVQIEGEFDDTMVIWNLVDSDSPLGLKYLTEFVLKKPENLEKKRALDQLIAYLKLKNIAELCQYDLDNPEAFFTLDRKSVSDVIGEYCCEDVENTNALYLAGMEELRRIDEVVKGWGYSKSPLDYYFEEARPLERVLFEIENRGVRIGMDKIEELRKTALQKISEDCEKLDVLCARLKLAVEEELATKAKAKIVSEKEKKPLKKPTPAAIERRRAAIERGQAKIVAGQGECAFSWQNSNHVAAAFFKHGPPALKSYARHTKGGALQLDKGVLDEALKNERLPANVRNVIGLFLGYRKWAKIASTYAGNEDTGIASLAINVGEGEWRVFPKYRQTTGTGRLACSAPNMQNLPRDAEVKKFFIPDSDEYVFDDADYSQVELRIAAHHSGDRTLINSYLNEEKTGQDTHCLTASRMFGRQLLKKDCKKGTWEDKLRQAGKRTNFLTIYKGKAPRLRASLLQDTGEDFSLEECKEFIEIWFETYPDVKKHLDNQLKEFSTHHCVIAPNGRMRRLPDLRYKPPYFKAPWDFDSPLTDELLAKWKKKNPTDAKKRSPDSDELGQFAYRCYAHAEKAGYNQPIQGHAGSLTKKSLVKLHYAGIVIANTVHDSITIARKKDSPETTGVLISIMENIEPLKVPLKVDVKTLSTFHPDDSL
jgi:DNA polymerase I-like protein with 3'-5' exonuclease and polymerase domains